MNQRSTIVKLIKDHRKTQRWLGEQLGYTGQSGVGQMLLRGGVTVKTLLQICEVFDYELTIQPKRRAGVRPQGQIVIDEGEGASK